MNAELMVVQNDSVVVSLTRASLALAEALTIGQTKKIIDMAAAAEIYVRRQQLGDELSGQAKSVKLDAQRKLGEMLKAAPKAKGVKGRFAGGTKSEPPAEAAPTLDELGLTKKESAEAQQLAALPEKAFEEIKTGQTTIAKAVKASKPAKPARKTKPAKAKPAPINTPSAEPEEMREVAKTMRNRPHVANNSGNNEWYTPPEYLEAARSVMGSIDTDPASSAIANKRVRAKTFYTVEQDGLSQKWGGNVWMNPPYSQCLVAQFAKALIDKCAGGEIEQACVLVNNATETGWFQLLAAASAATCFTKGRVRFFDRDDKPSRAPLQGQAILYFGGNAKKFAAAFSVVGYVYIGRPLGLAA